MNATLLYVALLGPGYGEKEIVDRIISVGGGAYRDATWIEMAATTTDADLGDLCELRRLVGLSLQDTKITDLGLRTVSELSGLRVLNLGETAITDQGLRHLESMSSLRALHLVHCANVTSVGVARLQKMLPDCKIIR
jgi:hypothetical protein